MRALVQSASASRVDIAFPVSAATSYTASLIDAAAARGPHVRFEQSPIYSQPMYSSLTDGHRNIVF